ncbi:AcrR family transcriptional regulator [Agrobacterium tumefaciens]|uniref:AcrR family transcriptional regulator n=1 Tax=Agrobacterium radiobacter TaxID=362 RepID=A0ABR6JDL7_AGRRD|nr:MULTISPECIES: TetR/AcrR family transcriptional regulator [Agrobacterium tumefaciens complex]MBB4320516.1 AcrR family transcriptional regulator [Agrobacterium radiobacter]MBB4337181.1 AcrR family transcriptional regulator [Agrobacterium radiobacter]MBB4492571.1 AcrR family transcriptional regulator [Agrobacterium radiobacter]MBB4497469.1 AcrR family transcriptional regulator [Agrobacterium radiobacter]MBB4502620.1 AcrR family transcriptional regulator [Agrobacterium radiobacter]
MGARKEKEDQILRAAESVFVRYGFARTTMGDIATAAGVSRPALYLQFQDKEAIFSRVIENMDAQALTRIRTALAGIGPLEEKLLHACTIWGMHGVELAAAYPDAADLFDLRFPAVRQVYRNFQALVVEILQTNMETWPMPVSPEDYALALTFGMRGLRYAAQDVPDMRRLIGVHVAIYSGPLAARR